MDVDYAVRDTITMSVTFRRLPPTPAPLDRLSYLASDTGTRILYNVIVIERG